MPKLHIDGREVEVAEGSRILDAARKLGVEIPTMCHLDSCDPFASCMICVVKNAESGALVPACSALAEDGMRIVSNDDEVMHARKQALELLLSDHVGDCAAPCEVVCPANILIPRMIRKMRACDTEGASAIASDNTSGKKDPCEGCDTRCERVCRRKQHDEAVAIRALVRFATGTSTGGQAYPRAAGPASGAAPAPEFNCTVGRLLDGELAEFMKEADDIPRVAGNELSADEAQKESRRCLHCDCRAADSCKLRDLATEYGAKQRHFRYEQRNRVVQIRQHAGVIYEPEKCIKCGLCVQITHREAEPIGLAFVGRGFDVRISTPFGESLDAALTTAAEACVNACPTGALAWSKD